MGNGSNPLGFINYLCTEAVSPVPDNASDYVFYEDRTGFHFRTMSNLIKQPATKTIYMAETNVLKDDDVTSGLPADRIIAEDVQFVDTMNTVSGYTAGMYQNTVSVFDPLRKTYRSTSYSYHRDFYNETKDAALYSTLNKNRIIATGSYKEKDASASGVYLIGQLGAEDTEYHDEPYLRGRVLDRYDNVLDTVSRFPFRRHETMGIRRIKHALLENSIRLNITLPGDHTIVPGQVIELFVPQTGYNLDTVTNYNILFGNRSPRFLIYDVAHRYDTIASRFKTQLRVVKDSFGEPPRLKKAVFNDFIWT